MNRILKRRNTHPTVKPVELMRWLVRMITLKGGTVLDPFAGSGTTGVDVCAGGHEFRWSIEMEKRVHTGGFEKTGIEHARRNPNDYAAATELQGTRRTGAT